MDDNTTSVTQHVDTLMAALAELEANVETPFVPGELEQWINDVAGGFQRLRPLLHHQISNIHPEQYDEIGEEDEELFRRVEQMREEDAAIIESAGHLGEEIPKLQTAAANVEPDEARLRTAFDAFVESVLEFIIRVRTQEQAVRTWLMEAFTRDRGDVD